MNLKNYLFCALFLTSSIKSAELEQESKQEKEQTNYEKLLAKFPCVGVALLKKNINKDVINNYESMKILDENTVYFTKDNIVLTIERRAIGYKIVTTEKQYFHAAPASPTSETQ